MITFRLALAMSFIVCTHAIGQTSFWPDSATPNTPQVTSTSPVTLGLKFYSDVPGYVLRHSVL